MVQLRPGEIYFADFGGDEHHRVVIVSREELNRGKYVLAVPFTSSQFEKRSKLASCVPFLVGEFGCTRDCVARADNLSFMEVSSLQLDLGVIDQLDDMKMRDVIRAIGYSIASDCEPDA